MHSPGHSPMHNETIASTFGVLNNIYVNTYTYHHVHGYYVRRYSSFPATASACAAVKSPLFVLTGS